jgi:4-amino-4-deoxychorismate lyase
MSQLQLLETIRMENGELPLLTYHLTRMHTARKRVWRHKHPLQGVDKTIKLAFEKACLKQARLATAPIVKCRVLYQREIEQIEFMPYEIKSIDSVKIIEDNYLKYDLKFADRTALEALKTRAQTDEVLIVQKGLLTDTTYTNVALWNGLKWLTPATPLLLGTRRAFLLDREIIKPRDILKNEIQNFSKIKFFNAMVTWEEAVAYDLEKILVK